MNFYLFMNKTLNPFKLYTQRSNTTHFDALEPPYYRVLGKLQLRRTSLDIIIAPMLNTYYDQSDGSSTTIL